MNVAVSPAAIRLPGWMKVDEFLVWAEATPGRWELVDGVPREMTPPLRVHGALVAELARLIGNHLSAHRQHWSVLVNGGITPAFLSAYNMRSADLVVTGSPAKTGERAIAEPVLAVEVLSPSNEADTWSNVRAYTSIPSVLEILIVRGDMIGVHVLRRQIDGSWPDEPETNGNTLILTSIHFSAPLAALYRRTPLAPD